MREPDPMGPPQQRLKEKAPPPMFDPDVMDHDGHVELLQEDMQILQQAVFAKGLVPGGRIVKKMPRKEQERKGIAMREVVRKLKEKGPSYKIRTLPLCRYHQLTTATEGKRRCGKCLSCTNNNTIRGPEPLGRAMRNRYQPLYRCLMANMFTWGRAVPKKGYVQIHNAGILYPPAFGAISPTKMARAILS